MIYDNCLRHNRVKELSVFKYFTHLFPMYLPPPPPWKHKKILQLGTISLIFDLMTNDVAIFIVGPVSHCSWFNCTFGWKSRWSYPISVRCLGKFATFNFTKNEQFQKKFKNSLTTNFPRHIETGQLFTPQYFKVYLTVCRHYECKG